MKKIFLMIGPPGAGKGDLGKIQLIPAGYTVISTGDICRQMAVTNKEVAGHLERKEFVPDNLMNKIFLEFMQQYESEKIFLDGYPRTLTQALFIEKNGVKVEGVIHLDVSKEIALERQAKRAQEARDANQEVRPGDTSKEAGIIRIQDYYDKTVPVLAYYSDNKKPILSISGGRLEKSGEPEAFQEFLNQFETVGA